MNGDTKVSDFQPLFYSMYHISFPVVAGLLEFRVAVYMLGSGISSIGCTGTTAAHLALLMAGNVDRY